MLEQYYGINEGTGISINLLPAGVSISACGVTVKDNKLDIGKKVIGLTSAEELQKHLPAKTYLSVNLYGKGILQKQGFTNVHFADGGLTALQQVELHPFDLILLDMQMPDLDGLEVCKRIRAQPAFIDIPILVQTATVDRKQMGVLFAAGASDFLSKPVSPSDQRVQQPAQPRPAAPVKSEPNTAPKDHEKKGKD